MQHAIHVRTEGGSHKLGECMTLWGEHKQVGWRDCISSYLWLEHVCDEHAFKNDVNKLGMR